jgi:GTP pyrophosphokinase
MQNNNKTVETSSLISYLSNRYPHIKKYLSDFDVQKDALLSKTLSALEKNIEKHNFSELSDAAQLTELIISMTETDRYTVPAAFLYAGFNSLRDIETNPDDFHPLIYKIAHSVFKFPDIGKMNFSRESDNFIKLLLTVMGDVRAVIIRLFEQLRRSRNASDREITFRKKIAAQNLAVFAPAAHRIGLYKLKEELENLSLQYSQPEVFRSITNKLEGTKADRERYIVEFLKPIRENIEKRNLSYSVKWRTKSVFSVWNKMMKKNVSFDEVYDLFALRIILDSKPENEIKDCWQVYSLVTEHYKPDTTRLRDWISFPKASGYESLQTTVYGPGGRPVEVQIRTVRMDDIAEKGPAAHWKYKGAQKGDSNLWLENMRKAIENPEDTEGSSALAKTAAPENFIVTPKGDLIALKNGYTVIDLAFMIHTDVGETCTGAMVNGKIRPIGYQPKNGDQIRILTDKKTSPGRDWLNIAKSSGAKARIRRFLNLNIYTRANEGKELLAMKFKQLKLNFSDDHLKKLRKFGKYKSNLEMFHAYAAGKADTKNIKAILFDELKDEASYAELPEDPPGELLASEEFIPPSDYMIIDRNLTSIEYSLAKCCKPLPGDKIFGFNTANKGLKIHKINCPNARDMRTRYAYRVVEAKWNEDSEETAAGKFIAELTVKGTDKTGMAEAITKKITQDFDIKLKAIALRAGSFNSFVGTISVEVANRKQLTELIADLRHIPGVSFVRQK